MRLASLFAVAIAMCAIVGCRPKHYIGAAIDLDRPGEFETRAIDPKWEHIRLREAYEDNRGGVSSKVVGEITRK